MKEKKQPRPANFLMGLGAFLIFVGFAAIMAALISFLMHRPYETHGITTQGIVTNKYTGKDDLNKEVFYIDFVYQYEDSNTTQSAEKSKVRVQHDYFDNVEIDSYIDVVYLPEDPSDVVRVEVLDNRTSFIVKRVSGIWLSGLIFLLWGRRRRNKREEGII